jgi:Mg2+/Co2+ transporter CorC
MLDDQTFIVQAQLSVEEVNELLNLDLPVTEDYQTLGGFLIYQLQKIPTQGEKLRYKNLEFTVISAEGQRLDKIKIYQLEELESGQTVNVVLEDEAGEKVNLIPSEELIDNFSSQLEVDGQDI